MSDFLQQIAKLRIAHKDGKPAPHKAVLLLSILELIEFDLIKSNRIPYGEDLKNAFDYIWKRYLCNSSTFNPDISAPFWYMQSEPFWEIHTSDGKALSPTAKKSMKILEGAYAVMPQDVYDEMRLDSFRSAARVILISRYLFPQVSIKDVVDVKRPKVSEAPIQHKPSPTESKKGMRVWLIPSNSKIFNLKSCFNRFGSVYWSQNVNFQKGDLGYIYSAAPDSRILFKVSVVKSDLRFSPEIQREKEFYRNESDFQKNVMHNRFALLSLSGVSQTGELDLQSLMKHGLMSAPQGTMVLSNTGYRELLKYIEKSF